jgi:SAM-dependent methyltransferase
MWRLALPAFTLGTFFSYGWWLTIVCLVCFYWSGFYTYGRAYQSRYKALIVFQAVSQAFLIFGFATYFFTRVGEVPRVFAEFHRVLEPGGLVMFSTFGPDTLKELRAAYASADGRTHVHRFIDMHDLGDMLVNAGFADPVMDMEYVTLTYAAVRDLMRDLKAIGARNAARGRPAGLTGKALLAAVERHYESERRDGRLPATFEVVYGHAWKPQPRVTAEGKPIIPVKSIG